MIPHRIETQTLKPPLVKWRLLRYNKGWRNIVAV